MDNSYFMKVMFQVECISDLILLDQETIQTIYRLWEIFHPQDLRMQVGESLSLMEN